MAREGINIPKEMYLWAIERAGYKTDEFLKSHPKISEFLEGYKIPTIRQIEDFAKRVHVPLPMLLLPSPPMEVSPIPMFRGKAGEGKFNLNVYQTVLDIQGRQEWLSDYIKENELDACLFVGKYSHHTPVKEMVQIIYNHLGLSPNWMMDFSSPEKAINGLVEIMEGVGICVFFNGIVGNNTHRALDIEECRGFALVAEENAPMIFVNNKDSKTAQMFTLAHEFTHVLVGVSAGYAGIEGNYHDIIETYCDNVAAEFLVPEALLKEYWSTIEKCSKIFKVSRLVIARRAHDLHLITDEEYRAFYNLYRKMGAVKKKNRDGVSYYATATKRLGKLFSAYIYNAVRTNQLSYTEAYRLTGMYGNTFEKYMAKLF